jgi:hypothetical protein
MSADVNDSVPPNYQGKPSDSHKLLSHALGAILDTLGQENEAPAFEKFPQVSKNLFIDQISPEGAGLQNKHAARLLGSQSSSMFLNRRGFGHFWIF